MKIAITYNEKTSNAESQGEFVSYSVVDSITEALQGAGHKVRIVEVTKPAKVWMKELEKEKEKPDLVFNLAEGWTGKHRQASFLHAYEILGLAYTGSCPHTLLVCQDKWLTKRAVEDIVVNAPDFLVQNAGDISAAVDFFRALRHVIGNDRVIVKPNFEGSSKGITKKSVCSTPEELEEQLRHLFRKYPDGLIVEQFIPGVDITVPWLEDVGAMPPLTVDPDGQEIYSAEFKNTRVTKVRRDVHKGSEMLSRELVTTTEKICKRLGLRDMARVDYRLSGDRLYFLEMNATPTLSRYSGSEENPGCFPLSGSVLGLSYASTILAIVRSAVKRWRIKDEARKR
jgi:D-alanine-D-alanine ligase-like ATP-grasp enzyme